MTKLLDKKLLFISAQMLMKRKNVTKINIHKCLLNVLICCCCLLSNDVHVLQLRSETVAVRRRMVYGLDDIGWPFDNRGRIWPKFPEFVLRLMENP